MSNSQFIDVEGVVATTLVTVALLWMLLRFLGRQRPELSLLAPLTIGFALRLAGIGLVALSGIGASIRGGDEAAYLAFAHQLAQTPWSSPDWLPGAHASYLHVVLFAAQIKLFGASAGALRVTQVAISLAGVILIATAVYDLSGARASRLAAWLIAVEPASVFFNSALLKEPNMELASGLVVFGAARLWLRLDLRGIAVMLGGTVLALLTRQYVGWALAGCTLLISLHAGGRRIGGSWQAPFLVGALLASLALALPTAARLSSGETLRHLQVSQAANTTDTTGNGAVNGNNLALGPVDFSSRSAIVTNLPIRIRDILVRPYPWQVANTSQKLGALGSIFALTAISLTLVALIRRRVLARVAPILYPFGALLIVYALSVGNAGTGFRYRTHLLTLLLAVLAALWRPEARVRLSGSRLAPPDGFRVVKDRTGRDSPVVLT